MPNNNSSQNQEGFDSEEEIFNGFEDSLGQKENEPIEYEFSEKNFFELGMNDLFIVIAIDGNDPYESFGPFSSKEEAEEWLEANSDQFLDQELIVVPCSRVEENEEEYQEEVELSDEPIDSSSDELIIDEEDNDVPTHYEVYDIKEKKVVSKFKGKSAKNRARAKADKLDEEYGAHRYEARPVYKEPIGESFIATNKRNVYYDPEKGILRAECPNCPNGYDFKVEKEQYENWRNGVLIQNAFPHLSQQERELLLGGICNSCLSEQLGDEDEDEDEGEDRNIKECSSNCLRHVKK